MRYFVVATHLNEEREVAEKFIAGVFNDFMCASIFRRAYNEYYKADAVVFDACKLISY